MFRAVPDPGATGYANKNPYFSKFTCFGAGTLGFQITPLAANEDYDWYHGISPAIIPTIFYRYFLIVTGNWAGTHGATELPPPVGRD